MSSDTELVVLFAMLHLLALAAGGGLLLLALHAGDRNDPHHERGAGGNGPPDPPRGPITGPPLPVAAPARVRLRGPARLADLLPPPPRRGTREPEPTPPKPVSPPADTRP
jgi:hypothetical protein